MGHYGCQTRGHFWVGITDLQVSHTGGWGGYSVRGKI